MTAQAPFPERASDSDRDHAIAELRERSAAGELSHDTFVRRMDIALRARSRPELAALFCDLSPGRLTRRLTDAVARASALSARLTAAWRTPRLPRFTLPVALPGDPLDRAMSPRFTIGREPGCDLVIPDLTVSRRHADLTRVGDHWLLCDLGSMNGTRRNGWRISSPVPVQVGDQLTFGRITFLVGVGD
jgi:FHA domain/DUF1707 SHOCT-like domain